MKETFEKLFKSAGFKFVLIGILSLLLLIPASMIKGLINERQSRSQEAIDDICSSWSYEQTVTGPFLSTLVVRQVQNGDKSELQQSYLNILPDNLNIETKVVPETKKRGIFEVVVYNSEIHISGSFKPGDDRSLIDWNCAWNLSYLCIGISDLRGIGTGSKVVLDGESYPILSGLPGQSVVAKGVQTELPEDLVRPGKEIKFDVTLELKGSRNIYFTPLGKTTSTTIYSNWPDPSFTGSFLPDHKEITKDGFTADWSVSYLNRSYPQEFVGSYNGIENSAFGVSFLIPVDHYQKATRAVKYAFMFIALTFLLFFLSEVISGARFHPVQYLLTGLALVVFYTLLVSLSEHTGFNVAYLISTLATTGLIAFYVQQSNRKTRITVITTSILALLYGFLFTTLQVQDYALLIGSVGLFVVLAIVMTITGKIRWYKDEEPS